MSSTLTTLCSESASVSLWPSASRCSDDASFSGDASFDFGPLLERRVIHDCEVPDGDCTDDLASFAVSPIACRSSSPLFRFSCLAYEMTSSSTFLPSSSFSLWPSSLSIDTSSSSSILEFLFRSNVSKTRPTSTLMRVSLAMYHFLKSSKNILPASIFVPLPYRAIRLITVSMTLESSAGVFLSPLAADVSANMSSKSDLISSSPSQPLSSLSSFFQVSSRSPLILTTAAIPAVSYR
mmetsp:Transcript_49119/g.127444  ORF Transcript_49119/g.127444 Transcript_49119/m.127444 type:complete len:237 (-) Transcript_49119:85-795(-)